MTTPYPPGTPGDPYQQAPGPGVPPPQPYQQAYQPTPPPGASYQPGSYQLGQYPVPPAAGQRNQILFGSAIAMIVLGGIYAILGLIALIGAAALSSAGSYGSIIGGLVVVVALISLLVGAFFLVPGILGVQNAGNPAKAGLLMGLGIAAAALSLISVISTLSSNGNPAMGIVMLAAAGLFTYGAIQLKQQV